MLLLSLKGLVLCNESSGGYVLEYKGSPCSYHEHKNEKKGNLFSENDLNFKQGTCVDYDLSHYSFLSTVFKRIQKRQNNHYENLILDTEICELYIKPNLFLTKFQFVNLSQKIISSTVLII